METVLVIVRSMEEASDWRHLLTKERFPNFRFVYPSSLDPNQDYYTLFISCCELIDNEDITAIISGHEGLQLIHAVLGRRYPQLSAPSVDSVCVIQHRFYARQMTALSSPNGARMVPADSSVHAHLAAALEDVQGPIAIKNVMRTTDTLCKLYKHKRHLWKDITEIRKTLSKVEDKVLPFLKEFANVGRFNRLIEPTLLIEENYCAAYDILSRHIVECCVTEEDFIPWEICDKHYWNDHPHCLKGISIPSVLSEHTMFQTWAIMREIVHRLGPVGFDNYFLRAEVAVLPHVGPHVLDIACGPYRLTVPLYRQVLINGDTVKAQLDMATGNVVRRPKLRHSSHGYLARISTFSSGLASDMLNIKQAKTTANMQVLVAADQGFEEDDHFGTTLALYCKASQNQEECMDNVKSMVSEVMKVSQGCPWLEE